MENQHEFFVVALPGLEDLVLQEITEWFPGVKANLEHGGVTVHASLEEGLAMNQALKAATRILLRVKSFRVRDFPRLYQTVAKIPWKRWVDPSCEMEVHVSTRLSRLKIKSRVEETCLNGWRDYVVRMGVTTVPGKKVSLYVRMLNDVCTLSLDTSGERLHKRGARTFVGEAPLRETIASALIQMVGRGDPQAREVEIVDPMMGSGTFLLEAAYRDRLVSEREFAFASFTRQPKESPVLKVQRPRVAKLTGYEADTRTMEAAKTNLSGVSAEMQTNLFGEDFFASQPMPRAGATDSGQILRRWLFVNPPYGERLKVEEPLAALYERLFAACERVVAPDRACFLLPSRAVKGKFRLPVGWKVLEKRPFLNGGIPVTAFVFGRATGDAKDGVAVE